MHEIAWQRRTEREKVDGGRARGKKGMGSVTWIRLVAASYELRKSSED